VLGVPFLAPPAHAGDVRPVEIPLVAGGVIQGSVESADAKEAVVRVGVEEVRRIPWQQMAPLGVWRVRAALAPPTDGEARMALAELAADLGLWAQTREEYEKALALGALDAKSFQRLVADAERRAVEAGVESATRAADAGDVESAMETARRLKLDFTNAPNAAMVDKLIGTLLARMKTLDADAAAAAAELEKAKVEAARNKEVLRRLMEAATQIDSGDVAAREAAEARPLGRVTVVRKASEAADGLYVKARKNLGRLRRILPRESEQRKDVMARLGVLDGKQFALLLATTKFCYDQGLFTQADEWANRAAYLDPVHPDLLEIREALREKRIRYKLSDITNARPIVR
jgi:hypothetical protein